MTSTASHQELGQLSDELLGGLPDARGQLALAMPGELLSTTPASVAEVFAAEKGYPTPKVDVRTAVFSEGRILLVR